MTLKKFLKSFMQFVSIPRGNQRIQNLFFFVVAKKLE